MNPLRPVGFVACCVAVTVPAFAHADPVKHVRLPAQPLQTSLQALAQLFQVELLFSNDAIARRSASALTGSYRIEQALAILLEGTGFTVRRSGSGGYIVVPTDSGGRSDAAQAPVPEVVVIGRRTQNADIRRFTNDVQPYDVLTRADVRSAHASTIEELIGNRMSADARGLSLSQTPVAGQGSPQSTIDLRGLGADQTLVLVDGRRMPRLPSARLEFGQPDLNGLSPEAIERVEVATSTAGGIYGPGAIAGVVNLVLRRDYRGVEVAVTDGISARGDAPYRRLDARVGFTPDHGATDVMVAYSRSNSPGLRVGDRDYAQRADTRAVASFAGFYRYGDLPASNSINVASSARTPLTLKPEYGGATLGGFVTTLPQGGVRSTAETGAILLADAGRVDTVPSTSADGGAESLTTAHDTSTILANIRHDFGGVELYGDFARLVDKGSIVTQRTVGILEMSASDPRNPFQQAIDISFPAAPFATTIRQRIVTLRASVGAVADLPGGWKGNFDVSLGSARQRMSQGGTTLDFAGYALLLGYAPPGAGVLNPFGDSAALQAGLAAHAVASTGSALQTNRMSDVSLRLAGPVATLPGGALFVTLLAEQRRESVPVARSQGQYLDITYSQPLRGYLERVRSGYVEVRAPIFSGHASFAPLRGLEAQFAVRVDSTRVDASPDPADNPSIVYDRFTGAERAAVVYTAGLKVRPLPGLLVRSSIATGETAPPVGQLAGIFLLSPDFPDPKRGNRPIGSEQPYKLTVFKDPLIPERARTWSAGVVATPFGATGPTISVDYARIRRSREASGQGGTVFEFLYHEDLYPGRVTRAALTPEDAAKGYTAGVVTAVDASYTTLGWTRIDAVDGRFLMPFHTAHHGDIALHLAVTWQPYYRRYVDPAYPPEDLVNRIDGALAVRGNAGLDWSNNALRLGLVAQVYGGYSVESGGIGSDSLNQRYVAVQGASRIAAAVTLDLATEYRFTLPGGGARPRALDVRFGIQDLLDRRPATLVSPEGGYSLYADPRRRRFELTLAMSM